MPAIQRGQTSNFANPVLDVFFAINGVRTDVYLLEYRIFEKVTNPGTPVQVYPSGGGRATVNLALGPAGHKIDTGNYVAVWAVPAGEVIGTHEVRWYYRVTSDSSEAQFREEFEVTSEVSAAPSGGYCSIQDIRDEGVTVAMASDARLQAKIAYVSKQIDRYTGRFFEPRELELVLDGTGRHGLLLDMPIIEIESIELVSDAFGAGSAPSEVDLDDVRIYNRHMTGLVVPDDREDPRIEFLIYDKRYDENSIRRAFRPGRWPEGTQNVVVTGRFGYTESDETTPVEIRRAAVLMVIRDLEPAASPDRMDMRQPWRVNSIRTRDQSITYADLDAMGTQGVGPYTGDPEIDRILVQFTRPPRMGSV